MATTESRVVEDLLIFKREIEAGAQNVSKMLDILGSLEKVVVTETILKRTKIGKTVTKLKKTTFDKRVKEKAANVIAKWRQQTGRVKTTKTKPVVKAEGSVSAGSAKSEVKAEPAPKKPTSDKVRRYTPKVAPPPAYVDAKHVPSGVDRDRVRVVHKCVKSETKGPVVYWMSRDQRSNDNWALLYAQEKAKKMGVPLAVCFSLVPKFLSASIRMYGFMLSGLADVEASLNQKAIPFFLLEGYPYDTLPNFVDTHNVSLVVTDFSPLRVSVDWREKVGNKVEAMGCGFHVVDAHNIVPVWAASPKIEYGARTIRSKINKVLGEYLTGFPALEPQPADVTAVVWPGMQPSAVEWDRVKGSLEVDRSVPEVRWATGGETPARANLHNFLNKRLRLYAQRNDPNVNGCSNISPWLHFGHIASQRCVLEARKFRKSHSEAVASFVEEIVIRKELSDNHCYYNPQGYDRLSGLYPNFGNSSWAQRTLEDHAYDKRERVYSLKQFEKARTHEDLWNAAQLELVHHGKMHGFMRMYWAKKILEWSESPEKALEIAIHLNDKYSLDGRDPNGYVGCAWAIAGLHDQGWKEREVFGKIRYMNYAGCKRKFKVPDYIMNVNRLVNKIKGLGKFM